MTPPDPPDRDPSSEGSAEGPKRGLGWAVILMVGLVLMLFLLARSGGDGGRVIPYSEAKALVQEGAVEEAHFKEHSVDLVLEEERTIEIAGTEVTSDRFRANLPPVEDPALLPALEQADVTIQAEEPGSWASGIFLVLVPWGLLILFFLMLRSRGAGGGVGGGRLQQYLKGHTKPYEANGATGATFDDVAGCEQAKAEVTEVVEFLREPERFRRVGAKVPRGVLLDGPPGTGKTLLARAVAGEAGVPFFSISASEFIEMFVGVGAARVRSLFEAAKAARPSIIFIDEIDSIGRTRGTGLGGGHDEREQTLNQILSEMDGFEPNEEVIVLAATNRSDVLDPALLRPGRFDRRVTLDLPDLPARLAILRVHVRVVRLTPQVDLNLVARATIGFSGADLQNLVNEAALTCLREGREEIQPEDFHTAREKIAFGTERSLVVSPEEKRRLAIHEAGHTLVGWYQPDGDPVEKVTIVPRGRALGATLQVPEIERKSFTQSYLGGRLAVLLAGRAAEDLLTGQVSTGAEDDIKRATELARKMVSQWGMDVEIGPVDLRQSTAHPYLGKEMAQPRRFSEETAHRLDQAVARTLERAQASAQDILEQRRSELMRLIDELETRETLRADEIREILSSRRALASVS